MKYFKNCHTAEELKKEYRKLAMKLHPDIVGGDGEEFKAMQVLFQVLSITPIINVKTILTRRTLFSKF